MTDFEIFNKMLKVIQPEIDLQELPLLQLPVEISATLFYKDLILFHYNDILKNIKVLNDTWEKIYFKTENKEFCILSGKRQNTNEKVIIFLLNELINDENEILKEIFGEIDNNLIDEYKNMIHFTNLDRKIYYAILINDQFVNPNLVIKSYNQITKKDDIFPYSKELFLNLASTEEGVFDVVFDL